MLQAASKFGECCERRRIVLERKLEGGGINNDDDGEEKTLRAGDEAQQQARERACKDKRGAMAGFTNVFSVVSEGKYQPVGKR
jgi:hypothetical protein